MHTIVKIYLIQMSICSNNKLKINQKITQIIKKKLTKI